MKQTNYGNWVPGTLMNLLWGGTALFLAAVLFIRFLGGSGLIQGIFLALFALFAAMALYMQACRRAFSFTGGGVSFFPRPLGLSGWVNTPATVSPRATSASREGTAKSGVPMKTMRISRHPP